MPGSPLPNWGKCAKPPVAAGAAEGTGAARVCDVDWGPVDGPVDLGILSVLGGVFSNGKKLPGSVFYSSKNFSKFICGEAAKEKLGIARS